MAHIKADCDASDYGLGVVLSHKMPDGMKKPVRFYSRTLSHTERKYSQVEKEVLSCVVGVTRFHSYLWGLHFMTGKLPYVHRCATGLYQSLIDVQQHIVILTISKELIYSG